MNWEKLGFAPQAFQKSQFSISEFELGKIGSIHSPRQIFQNRSLNLWMNWQKSCPNLSFSVENKMGS